MPAKSTAEEFLALNPDGVVMSPGPGDPELLDYTVGDSEGSRREAADPRHLPGQPGPGALLRRPHLQAQVRPPWRQPPGARLEQWPGAHHSPEPRLRRRPRHAAPRARNQPRKPQRRHSRGAAAQVPARHEHPVPLGGLAGAPRQRVHLRQLFGHGRKRTAFTHRQ